MRAKTLLRLFLLAVCNDERRHPRPWLSHRSCSPPPPLSICLPITHLSWLLSVLHPGLGTWPGSPLDLFSPSNPSLLRVAPLFYIHLSFSSLTVSSQNSFLPLKTKWSSCFLISSLFYVCLSCQPARLHSDTSTYFCPKLVFATPHSNPTYHPVNQSDVSHQQSWQRAGLLPEGRLVVCHLSPWEATLPAIARLQHWVWTARWPDWCHHTVLSWSRRRPQEFELLSQWRKAAWSFLLCFFWTPYKPNKVLFACAISVFRLWGGCPSDGRELK